MNRCNDKGPANFTRILHVYAILDTLSVTRILWYSRPEFYFIHFFVQLRLAKTGQVVFFFFLACEDYANWTRKLFTSLKRSWRRHSALEIVTYEYEDLIRIRLFYSLTNPHFASSAYVIRSKNRLRVRNCFILFLRILIRWFFDAWFLSSTASRYRRAEKYEYDETLYTKLISFRRRETKLSSVIARGKEEKRVGWKKRRIRPKTR